MTIAAAAVSRNQQALGSAVALSPHPLPPLGNRSHRERSGVMVDAHRNPGIVTFDIVNTVGNRLAQLGIRKVMRIHLPRLALGTIGSARVFAASQDLFLLRIDRNCRLLLSSVCLHAAVDALKLGVPIRMLFAFTRLAIGLKAVTADFQKRTHLGMAHAEP